MIIYQCNKALPLQSLKYVFPFCLWLQENMNNRAPTTVPRYFCSCGSHLFCIAFLGQWVFLFSFLKLFRIVVSRIVNALHDANIVLLCLQGIVRAAVNLLNSLSDETEFQMVARTFARKMCRRSRFIERVPGRFQ